MGCQSSRLPNDKTKTKRYAQTTVGLLDINIINGKLFDSKTQLMQKADTEVFLKIQISNQQYVSKQCSNFNCEGMFNSYFSFFINSNYRADGRILEIELHKKYQTSGTVILGKGTVDITPYISNREVKQQVKCIISKNEPLGFIVCELNFTPLDYKTVSFRFEQFILRRRSQSNHNLRIEVLLGEQALSTSFSKDLPTKPASWTKDVLKFKIPTLLKFGKLMLFDNDRYLGQLYLKIQQFTSNKQNEELLFYTQIFDKDNNQLGNLKFSTIVGQNPDFLNALDKSVLHTKLQINVGKAQKSHSKNTSVTQNNSGVQITLKTKQYSEKFLDNDNQLYENAKNPGNLPNIYSSKSMYSIFSIEDLSKIDQK